MLRVRPARSRSRRWRPNHPAATEALDLIARVAALFSSLTETCKLLELDPAAYLLAAATRARANRDDVLTPMAWEAELARTAAARSGAG
jgi:hypothetical protein